ncbi:MAG: PilN domain-containing protein [Gammaproteobacteria bacterium]|nr:PilN domain-containing protein [Gammaproteobacteria bacterium]
MATRINLLDWRAELRNQRKQQFAVLAVGFVVLAALAVFGVVTYCNQAIEFQRGRNAFLTQQIAEMEKKIAEIQELEKLKQSLLARMRVIEELQQSRSATVHFFDEVVNTLPDGVHLTGIRQSGGSVQIDGIAESNGRISSYMKNFEASPWFADPHLIVIRTTEKNNHRQSEFQLRVRSLTKPEQKAEGEAGAEEGEQ